MCERPETGESAKPEQVIKSYYKYAVARVCLSGSSVCYHSHFHYVVLYNTIIEHTWADYFLPTTHPGGVEGLYYSCTMFADIA